MKENIKKNKKTEKEIIDLNETIDFLIKENHKFRQLYNNARNEINNFKDYKRKLLKKEIKLKKIEQIFKKKQVDLSKLSKIIKEDK